jgi:Ferritin-like domain
MNPMHEEHHMSLNSRRLEELTDESQDLHTDAMRTSSDALDELVEVGRDQRAAGGFDPAESAASAEATRAGIHKGLAAGGIVATTAFGAALLGLTNSSAFAAAPTDIQMLQTSASIESLAVSTYKTALTLPYVGGSSANPVLSAFAKTTMAQHAQHLAAFNSAVKSLGGKAQTAPDPKYVPVVNAAVATITTDTPTAGALAVVSLATTLENVAAETYVNNCSKYANANARKITASIMGVEAQHVAILTAVTALLTANASSLIALNTSVVGQLPAAAGSIGFPNAFYPTTAASPAAEGALS